MKRHLIIWWFFILGSLGLGSQLAASNQCIYNPIGCSDMKLCAVAVRNISSEYVWEKVDKYLPYVKEAQKRGLNCPSIRQSRGKSKPIVKVDELRSLFISQTEQNRRKLQQTLSSLGYYKSKVDGLYGKGTAAALRDYNKERLGDLDLKKIDNVQLLFDDINVKKHFQNVVELPENLDGSVCKGSPIGAVGGLIYLNYKQRKVGTLDWHNCIGEIKNDAGEYFKGKFTNGLRDGYGEYFEDSNYQSGVWVKGSYVGQVKIQSTVPSTTIEQDVAESPSKLKAVPTEYETIGFSDIKELYNEGNFAEAFRAVQSLVLAGHADAQFYLGKMYADGRGTLQLATSAHMWFNIASMNGSDEAYEARKTIAGSMTSSAIETAQQMAFNCIKSDYKDCGLMLSPSQPKSTEKFQPDAGQLKKYFISQSALKRKQLQYALKQIGFYRSSVDGLWGLGTKRALLNYIRSNQALSEMSEIYTSLISEVDVPSSFAAPKTTSTNTANGKPPKKSAQGYTKAQAEAICAPKARLLANETENNRKKSSGGKTITCKSDSDLFTFGTNNRFGTSMGTTKCRESSGGGWPGLIPLLLETDPASKARRAGEGAYQLAMKSCMAQYGWY